MPLQHSKVVGGSNANIILACSGARSLWEKAPPEKTSPYAQEGTALHNAMDHMIQSLGNDKPSFPTKMIGWTDEETGLTLTDEQCLEKLAPAWDALQAYIREHKPTVIWSENQVQFTPVDGAFGTIDLFMVLADGTVVCWDWKFGHNWVPVVKSPQLYFYTAAAMLTPEFKEHFKPGMTVRFAICQPTDNGDTLRTWDTNIADLAGYITRLKKAVAASFEANVSYTTGDHCRWCKGRVICPKLREQATGSLSVDPKDVDPKTLSELLHVVEESEKWCASVRKYAHEAAEERNVAIPGWKLVGKRATRKFSDAAKTIARLVRSTKVEATKKDLYTDPQPKSVAQVEKVLGKELLQDLLKEGEVVSTSSGTSLVHESDKREAIAPAAALHNLGDQLKARNLTA